MPASDRLPRNLFPVVLHHASASLGKAASVARISNCWPALNASIACFIFMIGPGHWMPHASTFITSLSAEHDGASALHPDVSEAFA